MSEPIFSADGGPFTIRATGARLPSIYVATHTHGTVTPAYASSLAVLTSHLTMWGLPHCVTILEDCFVDRGRDRLAASFLDSGMTHLLFLDADVEFGPADVARLIAADKALVAGAYLKKSAATEFAVSLLPGTEEGGADWDAEARAMRVEKVATGFTLIRRQVFEAIAEQMPHLAYEHEGPKGTREIVAFFEQRREDGRMISEDYTFCDRWAACGGDIWVCPDVRLRHWGRRPWEGALADHFRFGEA